MGFLPVLVTRTALEELSTINHKNERILRKSADLFVIPSVFCDMGGDFLRRLPFRRKKTRTGRVEGCLQDVRRSLETVSSETRPTD